jgi:DNA-directed RNA polymerase specialized sigma24 family protein
LDDERDRRGPPPPSRSFDERLRLRPRPGRDALSLVADDSERKRTFLTLKVAGYSYNEIAAQLGVSWRTVNRQLVRARAAARATLDNEAATRVRTSFGTRALVTANGSEIRAFRT